MTDVEIQQWIDFFERIGEVYYRTNLLPQWKKYEECKEPWQAIAFFLEGYAFERQGTNPGFAHAAVDAVDAVKKNSGQLCGSFNNDLENNIWINYQERLGNKGINPKRCPLNPDESGEQRSIFARLREAGATNLVLHTICLLRSDVRRAHDFISSIRGLGPKIASYYLRDIKEVCSITTNDLRYLLQPIDIWIWRTVHIMQGQKEFPRLGQVAAGEIESAAQFVVNCSHNHNPERVNMGMWYFAAMVCESEYRHGELLLDLEPAKKAWNEYVRYQENDVGQIAFLKFQLGDPSEMGPCDGGPQAVHE
jgi:hypothetical protein